MDTADHIGVVQASNNKELKEKVVKACGEHYCAEGGKLGKISMNNCLDGKSSDVWFTDEEGYSKAIHICQSWLY